MDTFTVSEFNEIINRLFGEMEEFSVEGEIVSLKISRNNAVFIELKDTDEKALLKVSNFAPWIDGLKQVSEGMKVVIHGRPEIYSPYGSFSFKVRKIEPVGAGALSAAFENLKKALNAEGLFAQERKRSLSQPMTRIALITAKGSAALADFTKILEENNSAIEVEFFPVLVQGLKSEAEVRGAIERNSQRDDIDAIVLTRGGGSLEDLASFNAESVARAVFASKVPVMVAVGHEVDTSIADLVADVRASTPSQAAYYLAEQNNLFLQKVTDIIQHMESQMQGTLPSEESIDTVVRYMAMHLRKHLPAPDSVDHSISILNFGLAKIDNLIAMAAQKLERVASYDNRLLQIVRTNSLHVDNHNNLLEAYNPDHVLTRGYSLTSVEGKYISDVSKLTSGVELNIKFKNGSVDSTVTKIYK